VVVLAAGGSFSRGPVGNAAVPGPARPVELGHYTGLWLLWLLVRTPTAFPATAPGDAKPWARTGYDLSLLRETQNRDWPAPRLIMFWKRPIQKGIRGIYSPAFGFPSRQRGLRRAAVRLDGRRQLVRVGIYDECWLQSFSYGANL
jgi:hypothetical protein